MNQSYLQCHPELFRGSKHVKVMWPIQLYFKTVNEKLYVQFSCELARSIEQKETTQNLLRL